jgi:hypothetical protein
MKKSMLFFQPVGHDAAPISTGFDFNQGDLGVITSHDFEIPGGALQER